MIAIVATLAVVTAPAVELRASVADAVWPEVLDFLALRDEATRHQEAAKRLREMDPPDEDGAAEHSELFVDCVKRSLVKYKELIDKNRPSPWRPVEQRTRIARPAAK